MRYNVTKGGLLRRVQGLPGTGAGGWGTTAPVKKQRVRVPGPVTIGLFCAQFMASLACCCLPKAFRSTPRCIDADGVRHMM